TEAPRHNCCCWVVHPLTLLHFASLCSLCSDYGPGSEDVDRNNYESLLLHQTRRRHIYDAAGQSPLLTAAKLLPGDKRSSQNCSAGKPTKVSTYHGRRH
ncbi:unnamed protein product, partial [Ascophyllum nodosum]